MFLTRGTGQHRWYPSWLCLTEEVDVYRSHGVFNRTAHTFRAEKTVFVRGGARYLV